MMLDAERATGLSNWGRDEFRIPFATLIESLNTEAQLHELGVRRAHRRLLDSLCTRLRLVEDRRRNPQIAAEQVVAPLFVIGLPRAGTTFLHNLLSQDPNHRSPMTWEIMYPSPPPEESGYATDPRIGQAEEAMEFEGFMGAELQAIHPFDARRPEECNFIWEHSLFTVNYMAWWNVPTFTKLLYSSDFRWVYEEHKQFLQHLQHRFRRDRWVLKTPAHMSWLAELFTVYPDARMVVCHRDPAKVLGSLSSNLVAWRKVFSDVVPPGEFGQLELQASGLKKLAAFRSRPELKQRFFDAHYLDVQRDAMAVVSAIYRHFDIPLQPRSAEAMRRWLQQDQDSHAKGARHSYALESYGLDVNKIDAVLGDYIREFGVQVER